MFFDTIIEKRLKNFFASSKIEWNAKIKIEPYKLNDEFAMTTNIAMVCANSVKQNPYDFALVLANYLAKDNFILNAKVFKPGFININFKPKVYVDFCLKIISKENSFQKLFFPKSLQSPKKIGLEFVSANPTGYLHVGHARQAAVGDILSNIFAYSGDVVTKIFYLNDAGKQMVNLTNSVFLRYLEICLQKEKIQLIDEGYFGEEIISAAKIIYNEVGKKYAFISFENGKISDEICFKYFLKNSYKIFLTALKQDLKNIGIKFNIYKKESAFQKNIIQNFVLFEKKELTYNHDGATFIKSSLKGDDKDRVLKKSDGTFTYIVPDICLFQWKFEQNFDQMVTILGEDHNGYTPRLKAILDLLKYDVSKCEFPIIQLVKLWKNGQEFKMSKRQGTSIWLRDVINEIGKDATRFLMISSLRTTTLEFDIQKAKSKNSENPVYYCQYAYARCHQILLKAAKEKYILDCKKINEKFLNNREHQILILIAELNKIINTTKVSFEPHHIFNYLVSFAKNFHSYYNEVKIINNSDLILTNSKLNFIAVVEKFLNEVFKIIGINTLKKM